MSFYNMLISRFFPAKKLSSAARRAGYTNDQIGIRSRYVRERGNWQEHLDNTRQYIICAAQKAANHGSVAVLGSGWLLDVPVEELSELFNDVYLVDIVHPEPVKERIRRLTNVHLITADLTGGAVQMAVNASSFSEFADNLKKNTTKLGFSKYDFVVSVNLLNQLDIILCDYLKERFGVDSEDLSAIRTSIQQQHIDEMPVGKSCLITDYQQIDTDISNRITKQCHLLYCKLPQASSEKEWNWLFDTNQRYSIKNNTTFRVKALCF